MSIYRGAGGAGDAVADSSSEALLVRELAIEAQADADAAAASAAAASSSASGASSSASAASTSASNAATSATNASNSASAASTSATNAANSATAAQTAETAAELAETNAETAETNAANSATAAATSATNAASSATTATTQATNASNSATAAATSATNASNSATAASTSASNASTSATAAASSASASSTSASNASTSATDAANSATAASGSASTATTQAGIATTQAGLASTSASNAATSETNAAASASTATTQATNASNSASAAATSATNAAASFDSFDDRYLGAKSSAPTLDNDGNTLLTGALYFNTVDNAMKVWSGTTWLDAYASLSGALLATNNLSDLTNTTTARTNLGVAIGTNVQAWDADLDTWATKTAPSGTVVGTSDSQTLTNKTLTNPTINGFTGDTSVVNLGSGQFYKDTSGNIGVGITPVTKLHIAGHNSAGNTELRIEHPFSTATATSVIRFKRDSADFAYIGGASVSITGGAADDLGFAVPSGKNIVFGINAVEHLRLASNGNVALGSTSTDPLSLSRAKNLAIVSTGATSAALTIAGGAAARIDFGVGTTRTGGMYSDTSNFTELYTSTALPLVFSTNATERVRITSAGQLRTTVTGTTLMDDYGCRAWVNFNGTGTVAIRASGNVSSITDSGTGNYTVNFTTAMPDANYAVFGNTTRDTYANGTAVRFCTPHTLATGSVAVPTFNITVDGASSSEDLQFISVAVIR